ncbi:hypothetical protein HZB08_01360, partial [Candidatus Saganbacteria bacterium]|nr:hypothetical protein [Candidatus Saganbacteria bacterium]
MIRNMSLSLWERVVKIKPMVKNSLGEGRQGQLLVASVFVLIIVAILGVV